MSLASFSINGKMKLDRDEYEDYILTGYQELTAKDIQDISDLTFAGWSLTGWSI